MTTFMSDYIPTLAAQFEVLIDQLDNVDLNALSEFDIKMIRYLSLQARDALNVAMEELNAVENKFSQMVVESLGCVYERPEEVTLEVSIPQVTDFVDELTLNERLEISRNIHPLEQHINYLVSTSDFNDAERIQHLQQFALENLELMSLLKQQETKFRKAFAKSILLGGIPL